MKPEPCRGTDERPADRRCRERSDSADRSEIGPCRMRGREARDDAANGIECLPEVLFLDDVAALLRC